MRHVSKTVVAVLALLMIVGAGNAIRADVDFPPIPLAVDLRAVTVPTECGWVDMEVVIEPLLVSCEEVSVTVTPLDGMRYDGPVEIRAPRSSDGLYRAQFQVFVVPDTSNGIAVRADCGDGYWRHVNFFITYGDTLIYLPRSAQPTERARPAIRPARRGNIRPGEFPSQDSLQGIPAPPTPDTDRKVYTRQLLECIKGLPDETYYDVCLELDEPSKMDLAQLLTDTLAPTEQEHQYLARTDRETIETLCGGGIWTVFKRIYIGVDPKSILPLLPNRGKTLLTAEQLAPILEMEKTPLTDSAMEIVTIEGVQLYRLRGEKRFGYYGRLMPTATMAELHEMERKPLTDSSSEIYKVDGVVYMRQRGDTLFYRRQDYHRRSRPTDDSSDMPIEGSVPALIDLRWSDMLETVQRFATERLVETAAPGIYRTVIDQAVADSLLKYNIRFNVISRQRNARGIESTIDTPDDTSEADQREPPDIAGQAELLTIFHEDFNSGQLDNWPRGDNNTFCGEDYWGLSSRVYHSGPVFVTQSAEYSVWCSGEGDMVDGLGYDCAMSAVISLDDGIDINGFHNLILSYWVNYDIENGHDLFCDEYWIGSGGHYASGVYSGYSGGWVRHEVAIPDDIIDDSTFYLSFWFTSDYEYEYAGVYLDDIMLVGEPLPNLTWYTPTAWSDAIVVSSDPGSNESGPVYANVTSYIDWAIVNSGYGDAGAFRVVLAALLEDSVSVDVIEEIDVTSLATGEVFTREDIQWIAPVDGEHRLFLRIDDLYEVMETDDSPEDNIYSSWRVWQPPAITFSGHLFYWDPHPPATQKPMRGIRIDMCDYDPWSEPDSLATAFTDDNGHFEMEPVINDESIFSVDRLDIFFKIYAENEASYVTRLYAGDTVIFQTQYANNVSNGIHDTVVFVAANHKDTSGAFYVADLLLEMSRWWTGLSGDTLSRIQVWLTNSGLGTGHIVAWDLIRVENSEDWTRWWPNTYSPDVIRHEYTHKIQCELDFLDAPEGTEGHGWCVPSGPDTASTEGFADFLPLALKGSPRFEFFTPTFEDTGWRDAETGLYTRLGAIEWTGSCTNNGIEADAAVAGIFWDIFDDTDDDFTTFRSFPPTAELPQPDGFKDSLSDGLGNILATLLDKEVDGHRPDNIEEFYQAWFTDPTPGHHVAMQDIWYEHGVECCFDHRGNTNCGTDGKITMSDVSVLIDHVYVSQSPLCCHEEGNVNASTDRKITLSDINALIDFLYISKTPTPFCPGY